MNLWRVMWVTARSNWLPLWWGVGVVLSLWHTRSLSDYSTFDTWSMDYDILEASTILAIVASAYGAFAGSRARLIPRDRLQRPVTWLRFVLGHLLLGVVAFAAILPLCMVATRLQYGHGPLPHWIPAVHSVCFTPGVMILAFAGGLFVRSRLAVPLAILIPYFVIGFAPAVDWSWYRHLFTATGCCSYTMQLDPRVVIATWVTYVVCGLMGLVLVIQRGRSAVVAPVTWGAAGVGATAIAAVTVLVWDVGYSAVVPRQGAQICENHESANGGSYSICLWPENNAARGEAAAMIDRTYSYIGAEQGFSRDFDQDFLSELELSPDAAKYFPPGEEPRPSIFLGVESQFSTEEMAEAVASAIAYGTPRKACPMSDVRREDKTRLELIAQHLSGRVYRHLVGGTLPLQQPMERHPDDLAAEMQWDAMSDEEFLPAAVESFETCTVAGPLAVKEGGQP